MALLVQLRTGHVLLQAYLCKIGKAESPICPKCHKADKMVSHFLTACAAFNAQRGRMERQLRRAARLVSTLLSNPKAFPSLFKYIHDTRRFRAADKES